MDIYVQHIEQLFHTDCHMLLCNVMDIYVPYIIPQALYMYLALLGACTHQKFVILIGVRRKCSRRLLHPGFFHLPRHHVIRQHCKLLQYAFLLSARLSEILSGSRWMHLQQRFTRRNSFCPLNSRPPHYLIL
jgi:hypothetical protein